MRGILDLTGQLSQVLKQFGGIYGCKLPETDGLTVEDWMDAHGVHRFVTKSGTKQGYTPALINAGWNNCMQAKSDSGKTMGNYVFKNVAAKYIVDEEEKEKAYRVFTKEEAEKIDGKAISVYRMALVDPHKWSVQTILRGLMQSTSYGKHAEKAEESEKKWADIEHVYIVKIDREEGKIVRRIIEVSKDRVVF